MRLMLVACLAVLVLLRSDPSRAACPSSSINGVVTTLPADSLVNERPGYGDYLSGSYDLVLGTLGAYSNGLCCSVPASEVIAQDSYRLTGFPSDETFLLTAELAWSVVSASFESAFSTTVVSGQTVAGWDYPSMPYKESVQLVFPVTGQQEFMVTWRVSAQKGKSGPSQIAGRFRFLNLPQGAAIESCQGFAGGLVPTQPTTWGAVKATYR